MSDAINPIELQIERTISYMATKICQDYEGTNNLHEMVKQSIKYGMEYQRNLDNVQRDFDKPDVWSGYHPSNVEPPLDETGLPYYGITKSI